MNKFKPEFLGKVLPEKERDRTHFLEKQYEPFNDIYDVCREDSDNITDISNTSAEDSEELSIRVSANDDTLDRIRGRTGGKTSMNKEVIKSKR